jgi:DNA primase
VVTDTEKIRFIKAAFGGGSVDVRGANIAVECPSCGKSGKRKLSIHIETGRCHCWVCGLRAKRVSSVLYKHVSKDVADEYRTKCEGGTALSDMTDSEQDEKEAERLTLPDNFQPVYSKSALADPDARNAVRYLFRRGLGVDDIVRFRLGVSSAMRRRVIIPSFDADGRLNFYTGRSVDPDVTLRYSNCKAKKTEIVFNELNIDWKSELVLVEGPFDLFKCPDNATCLLGSSLTEGHLLFQRIAANRTPVVLALDADMQKKSQRIAEMLNSYDCQVRVLDVSPGTKDVGDMTHAEVMAAVRSARHWRPMDRLIFSISSIRSGSIL